MIKLTDLLGEETFTAINKASGKTSVFKSKDARDAAVKAGTHSKEDEKDGGDEPKGEKKPNMFSKDAGYDAPDAKSDEPTKSEPSKYDSEYFADDEKSDSSPMGGYDDDDYYYDDEDDGKAGYKKTVERLDKVETALNDELKLRDNGFSTSRSSGGGGGYWEGPLTISSDDVPYDDERFVELSIGSGMNDGNFSIGFTDADGMEVFDGGYSITGKRELSPEEAFKLGKALMKNPDVQKFLKGQISKEEFKTIYDKLASKFAAPEPKEEPKSQPSQPKRQGNPKVNKATKAKAEELGITPQKLGKDEYKKKMAQAAVAALTDANFHSEARELISKLEGKPEWAEKPDFSKAPEMGTPEYDEWQKTTVYSSEYYDADDDTEDLGVSAAQEAGWSGDDAADSIAFTLRMNGFHNLADTIQSVIKENKSTKLRDLI